MFDSGLDIEHVFGHRPSVGRARVRRRRAVVVTIVLLLSLVLPAASRALAGGEPATTRYVVRPGDTLWSIAVRQAPGQDPRVIVDAIVRTNSVDPGTLVPGRELQLPG
jgi:LysM repeat protein